MIIKFKHTDEVLKDICRAQALLDELKDLFIGFKSFKEEIEVDLSESTSDNESQEMECFLRKQFLD